MLVPPGAQPEGLVAHWQQLGPVLLVEVLLDDEAHAHVQLALQGAALRARQLRSGVRNSVSVHSACLRHMWTMMRRARLMPAAAISLSGINEIPVQALV